MEIGTVVRQIGDCIGLVLTGPCARLHICSPRVWRSWDPRARRDWLVFFSRPHQALYVSGLGVWDQTT